MGKSHNQTGFNQAPRLAKLAYLEEKTKVSRECITQIVRLNIHQSLDQLPTVKFGFDLPHSVVVLAQFSSAIRSCCQHFKSAHFRFYFQLKCLTLTWQWRRVAESQRLLW